MVAHWLTDPEPLAKGTPDWDMATFLKQLGLMPSA
jgi:hypothetical protein